MPQPIKVRVVADMYIHDPAKLAELVKRTYGDEPDTLGSPLSCAAQMVWSTVGDEKANLDNGFEMIGTEAHLLEGE